MHEVTIHQSSFVIGHDITVKVSVDAPKVTDAVNKVRDTFGLLLDFPFTVSAKGPRGGDIRRDPGYESLVGMKMLRTVDMEAVRADAVSWVIDGSAVVDGRPVLEDKLGPFFDVWVSRY